VQFVGGDLDAEGRPIGALEAVARDVEQRGLSDTFRLLGSQPQNRLPLLYNASDVVCVPSRYESFGLVAVEAMACGIPVVASRAGGLIFSIDEGVSGLLVSPNDAEGFAHAMATVINDRVLAERMSIAAREQAHRFAWPVIAASMRRVYERLASGQRANLCCGEEIYA
jgi:D-inositol-3-phosphate glycosyltransferase